MFGLQGPESYLYTSRSGCLEVQGIDDVADFTETIVSAYEAYSLRRRLIATNSKQ
jgi:myosin-1